jgi:hypothetical protein
MLNENCSKKQTRALNLFVSLEQKQALEELAIRHERSLADVVRSILRLGTPILQRIWETERSVAADKTSALRKLKRSVDDF